MVQFRFFLKILIPNIVGKWANKCEKRRRGARSATNCVLNRSWHTGWLGVTLEEAIIILWKGFCCC